jgi:Flp pilus assembly protein TadD
MNARTLLSITALLALFGSVIRAVPRGAAFTYQGRTDEAIRQFQEALRLKPDYAEVRKNLDVALATQAASPPRPGASTHP